MITVSQNEFIQNPSAVSQLAKGEPVLVAGADKQVLMDYDTYQRLTGDKPFVSAYDAYMAIMSDFSPAELDALADADVEFDMSFLERD